MAPKAINCSVNLPFRQQGEFVDELLQPEFSLPLGVDLHWEVKMLAKIFFISSAKFSDLSQ